MSPYRELRSWKDTAIILIGITIVILFWYFPINAIQSGNWQRALGAPAFLTFVIAITGPFIYFGGSRWKYRKKRLKSKNST